MPGTSAAPRFIVQTMVSTASTQGPTVAVGDPDALPPGTQAGPWKIERELGRGGMGTVYAVTHAEIGKQAALKVVHRRVLNPGDEDRMRLEAQVVNLVGHPNIVDIFETGHLPDKRPYLVMERLEGVSLAQRAEEGKLLPDQVISILLQVCDALIAAHATGIIHRDLKLDNVFLIDNPDDPKRPRAKILDWGIAKVIAEHAKSTRHTIDGQLIGTPQYLSPEQARGGELTEKTDVYSLGVMAYELFLEQLPFEAETAAEIMTMHLRAVPPPASEAWPDIPTELEDLIHSMLAKNPLHRPTMLEVARKLEVVREELDRRRSQPITLPKVATGAAVEPAPIAEPLVVTQAPAVAKHRWQWFVGAAAVATCAMLLLVSQLVDSNAATASTLGDTPALLAPTPVEVAKPVIHKPTIAVNEPAAQPVVAPVVVEPKPVAKPTRQKPRYQLAPVAPRRNAKLDPDGTYDPYK